MKLNPNNVKGSIYKESNISPTNKTSYKFSKYSKPIIETIIGNHQGKIKHIIIRISEKINLLII